MEGKIVMIGFSGVGQCFIPRHVMNTIINTTECHVICDDIPHLESHDYLQTNSLIGFSQPPPNRKMRRAVHGR